MNIRRKALVSVTLVLTALLAACATATQNEPPAEGTALKDTGWVLVSLNGDSPMAGREITLDFEEATLEGYAGCNTYGGSYTVSEDSLRLSGVYATEMGCMEPKGIMDQERAFLDALNAAARFHLDGDRLGVYDEAGTQILAFVTSTAASQEPTTQAVSEQPGTPVTAEPKPTASKYPESQESDLTAKIDVPTSLDSGGIVMAIFTLTNTSSDGLFFLKWFTPLEGIAGDIFRVERDGAELPYRGKLVKRGPPISEDFVWLEAGESVSAEVDLAEGYDFSQAGQYTIQFRSPQISQVAETETEKADSFDELGVVQIPSNTVNVVVLVTMPAATQPSPASPTPTTEVTAVAPPASQPPAGFKSYQDSVAGVSIYVPESWVVTGIIPGQFAILQSYPENKYVGGGARAPGDTKCDLNIRPPDVDVAGHIQQLKSEPTVTIVSEGEMVLQSGKPGTRFEVDSMGRSLSLITEINERVVALSCFGELTPFDQIAVTLGETDIAESTPSPAIEPGTGSKQYQDAETGVSVYVPEDWVVTGVVPGHQAILQSYPENKYVGGEARAPGDTNCDLNIRPAGISVADFVQQMRTNTAITIVSEDELTLASGLPGIRMELESMGRSLSLITEVNERVVVLTCYGEFAPFDEIAVTLGANE